MPLSNLKCSQTCNPLIFVRLQSDIRARLASTARSAPYPYPGHRHPKPHEIFHLPLTASQAEIKSRYIDLVRAYHPDSAICSHVPASERHARFQAISAAYDHLRGKSTENSFTPSYDDQLRDEIRRRARPARNRSTDSEDKPDHAADIAPIIFGGLLIFVAIVPGLTSTPGVSSRSASLNLAEARREAQIYGKERIKEIRMQARQHRLEREAKERDLMG